jgi:hypothetical protein
MTKIFVRERRKIEEGEKKPRLRIVGVSGKGLRLYAKHVRKTELDMIAKESAAEVIYLPIHGTGSKDGSGPQSE